MVIYLILIVLFYFLIIAIIYFIKAIPKDCYLTKGKIVKWDKMRGDSNFIEYFPIVEYRDRNGNKKVAELKSYYRGWIRPREMSYTLVVIDKEGVVYLFSDIGLKPLISLSFVVLLIILIVNSLRDIL